MHHSLPELRESRAPRDSRDGGKRERSSSLAVVRAALPAARADALASGDSIPSLPPHAPARRALAAMPASQVRRAPVSASDVGSARHAAQERQAKYASTAAALGDPYQHPEYPAAAAGYPPAHEQMASRHGMQSPMAGHMVAHPAVYQQQVVAHPGYMHPYDGGVPEQLQAEAAAPAASEQQMIGCDHPECVKQWYNISDVGLTPATVPSGDWYCPACRETEDDYSRPRHRKGPRGKPKPGKRARRR